MMRHMPLSGLRGAALPLLLILIGEAAARWYGLQSDGFAAPSTILVEGVRALLDGSLLFATAQTLGSALGGLGIGAAIGIPAGILLGLSGVAHRLLNTSIELVRPIPSVALIPVAMLVFGFGYRMELGVVAFSTLWPLLILTRSAVREVEPRLLEVARVVGLSPLMQVLKIILPAALPRVIVALRLAVGIALIVSVTVEIAANPLGLGYGMMIAQQSLNPGLMFAMLIWIGMVGWGLNLIMLTLQARFLRRFEGEVTPS